MTVQKWINNGCDYEQGVLLYAQLGKNQILLKRFQKNQSKWNEDKLKNELLKFLNKPVKPVKLTTTSPTPSTNPTEIIRTETSPTFKEIKSKPIANYPPSLHSVYKSRINSFYNYASLKMQLNQLDPEKEEEALEIQFKIWNEIQTNEKCWKILNHFDQTGEVLPLNPTSNFSQLSPQEIVNHRQRLYVNKSKRMKTLNEKEKALKTEKNPTKIQKINQFILKKKKELQTIENDIEQLTSIVNGK